MGKRRGASDAVLLEREKRATMREEHLWELLGHKKIVEPAAIAATMIATFYMGKTRVINRDLAGAVFALEGTLAAAKYGFHDRLGLLGIWGTLAGVYALANPPTEGEAIVTLEPFGGPSGWSGGTWSDIQNVLLGSDRKLFFWG
jgi:hypothetical protein